MSVGYFLVIRFSQSNILFTKGSVSFNWKEIMDAVKSDLVGFYERGGWDFLDGEGDLEDPNKPRKKKKSSKENADGGDEVGAAGSADGDGAGGDEAEDGSFMQFESTFKCALLECLAAAAQFCFCV